MRSRLARVSRGVVSPGVREAPTPLVLLSGLTHSASAWVRTGLPASAAAAGWSVFTLDLPGFGAARGWPSRGSSASLDALVTDVRDALAPLRHAAPVLVAPSLSALVAQKYLESWPLAALVAVSPLPPAPGSFAS